MKIKISKIRPNVAIPEFAHDGDYAFDLRADLNLESMINLNSKENFDVEGLYNGFYNFKENDSVILPIGKRIVIPTGLRIQLPKDSEVEFAETKMKLRWVLKVFTRSGITSKHGIMVANAPGLVDSGYRNEIGVILYNFSDWDFTIKQNMRIAQAEIEMTMVPPIIIVDNKEFDETERGTDGFGSTGLM